MLFTRSKRTCDFIGVGPVLPVPHVTAAVTYYCERLGFELDFVMGEPPDHGSVTRGHVGVQFTRASHAGHQPAFAGWFYFFVENIDSLAAEYESGGIAFTRSLATQGHGMREFEIVDLNGFRLRFGQYA